MTNTLRINHVNHTIVMDRAFARNAIDTRSEEYAHLQMVRRDYPNYQVVQRHIRTNRNKKTYKGLTYDYMEDYILTHGPEETRLNNHKEFTEKCLISECHGRAFRYPVIKSWFLEKYPEIANFGMSEPTLVNEQGKVSTTNTDQPHGSAIAATAKEAPDSEQVSFSNAA